MAFQDNWHFNVRINEQAEIEIEDDGMSTGSWRDSNYYFFL